MNELNHLDDSGPNTFLLIGIGNSGRGDDGLGWAFVEAIEQKGNFRGRTVLRYQLQVEDADLISQYDQVIFVDAHQGDLERGFSFKKCAAEKEFSFTTHHLAPETIVFLCQELYQKKPNVHLLLIQGEKWELDIGLSAFGEKNLAHALHFFNQEMAATSWMKKSKIPA